MARLNPAQHRLLQRHVERAVEALEEADRLLKGAVSGPVGKAIGTVKAILEGVESEESRTVRFALEELPTNLVPYLDNPFAQALCFNRFCDEAGLSHTRATKQWEGGNAAVAARNVLFLPPVFGDLWDEGVIDKTRLVAIANRNLTDEAYLEVADMVKTRRKEDLDERLLKMPPSSLKVGRRGPEQALEAASTHGWVERFQHIDIAEELVSEATADEDREETPADLALRNLRAGLNGASIESSVTEALRLSPDPQALVEKFLVAHRKAGDADPTNLGQTLFFAHAGPVQKIVADDKLLLRHFRPVKTQKRGQLFYRLLEVLEEALLEKQHLPDLDARGLSEPEALDAVRKVVDDLNSDPNRYLVIPDEWLGEVTRRHLYFGSRTRKEGAAYKWFRKIGFRYFLGGHKTREELDEKAARKASA
ncbi:MAG: hypothetical protein ACPHID_06645 [Thermoplasmatota archaeon]